jgi:hypothetical protein
MRDALAGDSTLIRRFQEAGYDVAYTESSWTGSTCSALVDVCIRDGLTYRSAWVLGQITLLAPLLDRWMPHQFNAVSMRHLEELPEYTERGRRDGTPRLTIAHVILPHPPFEREADCSRRGRRSEQAVAASGSDALSLRRARYVDQAKCTNDLLIAALDEIIAAHPDVHVMLTADHGSATTVSTDNNPDSRSDEVLLERMAIFSAYRLPNCSAEVAATITPVNGTRLLTNCALGSSLDVVEDRSLWIPPNRSGSVVDVTNRLRN